MAFRELNYQRSVAPSPEADLSTERMIVMGAGQAEDVIRRAQEGKVAENISAAQLEMHDTLTELQVQFEADPKLGMEEFKTRRQTIFDKYGEGISPFFRQQWVQASQQLVERSDLTIRDWAVQQSRKNTIGHINTTMRNHLNQALMSGEQYASNPSAPIESFINYASAHEQLQQLGAKSLGELTTQEMLATFGEDYMKMFVTGVAEKAPEKALKLMDRPDVRGSFSDQSQYLKMREGLENKVEKLTVVREQKAKLGSMRRERDALAAGGKMNYADLNQEDLSDAARSYFERLNGFSKGSGSRGGYTNADKASYKLAVHEAVNDLIKAEDIDPQALRVVQDSVYHAMEKGALTQTQGLGYIDQVLTPVIEKKEQALDEFVTGKWNPLEDNLGFDGIQQFYEDEVEQPSAKLDSSTKKAVQAQNKADKANLYDYYYGALQAGAEAEGVRVGELNDLPRKKRQEVYGKAQEEAQRLFLQDKVPALRTLPDIPNFVYEAGKLIHAMPGKREVKATDKAQKGLRIVTQVDKNGNKADVFYQDGKVTKVVELDKRGRPVNEVLY